MFTKKGLLLPVSVVILTMLLGACGTKVEYGDPGAVETLTADFGSTDLQIIAEKMVKSLLTSPAIQGQHRPVLQVARVRNKTGEHIDMESITNKIRTTLINSGKVRFSAAESRDEIISNLEYQSGSGYVDPATQKKIGKQVGADFLLTGEISAIKKQRGKKRDLYYKITLNMVNLETGLIEWAEEKEIRKGES